ncbi:MAG: hypothetical protein AB2693_15425, partial [Candidatus Thiodiazotropha sp.]
TCVNVYVCVSFPIGFESGVWDLSVSIPDVFLISYFFIITLLMSQLTGANGKESEQLKMRSACNSTLSDQSF